MIVAQTIDGRKRQGTVPTDHEMVRLLHSNVDPTNYFMKLDVIPRLTVHLVKRGLPTFPLVIFDNAEWRQIRNKARHAASCDLFGFCHAPTLTLAGERSRRACIDE